MKFDIITIFPELFKGFLSESIIKRARKEKLIEINIHDLRDFTRDRHKSVDDKPFGGGRGMVLKVGPVYRAVSSIKEEKTKVVLLSPRGEKFNQKKAYQYSNLSHVILICGRYEGVDERIIEHVADETLSIGDYVLMGGELPAMVIVEAVSRLIPGVLGNSELLKERMPAVPGEKGRGFQEFPQYTRPEIFKSKEGKEWKVPKTLLSGNHRKIKKWRKNNSRIIGK